METQCLNIYRSGMAGNYNEEDQEVVIATLLE